MNLKFTFLCSCALVAIFLLFSGQSSAQITCIQSGLWNDPNTWDGGEVPGAGDDVVIEGDFIVEVDANASCLSLRVMAPPSTGIAYLIIYDEVTLTITDSLALWGRAATRQALIDIGNGATGNPAILEVGGNVNYYASSNANAQMLMFGPSELYVGGNLTAVSLGTISTRRGTLAPSEESTVIFNGGAAQDIAMGNGGTRNLIGYNNIIIRNSSSTVTLNSTAGFFESNCVAGNFTIETNATFFNNGKAMTGNLDKTFLIQSGGRLNISGSNVGLPIDFNLDFESNTTVSYQHTGSQPIRVPQNFANLSETEDYQHLSISGSGAKTLEGDINVLGNYTQAGTATYGSGGFALNLSGNFTKTAGTFSLSSGSFNFVGGSTQTITTNSSTFFDLGVNGAGVSLVNGITISGALALTSGTLAINANTLTLNGTVSGSSTITGGSSAVISIGGTGSMGTLRMTQTSSSTRTLNNFTINRTTSGAVTLGNSMEVTGTVTLSNGTLTTGGNLTLISTSLANTGRIATIAGTGAISGSVTVQRFIPSGTRRWMFLSAPVDNFNLSSQWMDDVYVTGPAGQGFDASATNAHSLFTYNEATTGASSIGWTGPSNANTTFPNGTGFRVFFRGDRSQLITAGSANNCVLDVTGTMHTGNFSFPVTFNSSGSIDDDGWNLIGNPYPSPISWSASGWTKTNLDGFIYVWNTTTNSYNTSDGTPGGSTGSATGVIGIGQGFMVKATAGSPALSITENVKVACGVGSAACFNFFKKNSTEPLLRAKMMLDSHNVDEVIIKFEPGSSSNYIVPEDASKFTNPVVNLATYSSNNKRLTINSRPEVNITDTVGVYLKSTAMTTHKLIFSDFNSIPSNIGIVLIDKFLNQNIDVRANPIYQFNITSDTSSQNSARFQIVFSDLNSLPVALIGFKGVKVNEHVELSWSTLSETNNREFIVERSFDGKKFESISSIEGAKNSLVTKKYSYTDKYVFDAGVERVYYRLKQVDFNEQFSYSNTVVLENHSNLGTFETKLYPVPAENHITLNMINAPEGNYRMKIISSSGLEILSEEFSIENVEISKLIDLTTIGRGVYFIELKDLVRESTTTLKFVK